jgi:hypothetical protein
MAASDFSFLKTTIRQQRQQQQPEGNPMAHPLLLPPRIRFHNFILIRMQMTELFGPQFKVIGAMAVDLLRFYILWFIILTMLTSLGCLVFMEVPLYYYFSSALYMHWDWALGAFDSSIFCTDELPVEICLEGRLFLFVFNSLNVVLLLNLIIAIMGSVYG